MPTERDPRIDPRPGDVLGRRVGLTLTVKSATSPSGIIYADSLGWWRDCRPEAWHSVVKDAGVITRADS